jgi:hypothetical protein
LSFCREWRRFRATAIVATTLLSLAVQSHTQASPTGSRGGLAVPPKPNNIYGDSDIKVAIPAGWRILSDAEIRKSRAADSLGNSLSQGEGKLVLEKDKYILALAYRTGHASGVEGGRFIEAFNIPWPEVDDEWTCSGYLKQRSQPASRTLMFTSFIVEPGPEILKNCGIKIDSRAWGDENGMTRRWYGGYFTTDGSYFFDSDGDGCGEKAYTFTFRSRTAEGLPNVNDPALKKMIEEAIDIVNSIEYKRCKPV